MTVLSPISLKELQEDVGNEYSSRSYIVCKIMSHERMCNFL